MHLICTAIQLNDITLHFYKFIQFFANAILLKIIKKLMFLQFLKLT